MPQHQARMLSFLNSMEGIAFLMCEFCKLVRLLISEGAMYRRGFEWSKDADEPF